MTLEGPSVSEGLTTIYPRVGLLEGHLPRTSTGRHILDCAHRARPLYTPVSVSGQYFTSWCWHLFTGSRTVRRFDRRVVGDYSSGTEGHSGAEGGGG